MPGGPSWPIEVAVSSSTPARLRSAPYAGTVAAFSASRSARGRSGRSGRDRVSAVAVAALQGGAEDGDHRAGLGVEHGASGGPAAQPEGVPSRGADRQLQDVFEEMEAVGGGVGHGGRAQHTGLAPAAGGEPDVGAGLDGVAHGHRQRVHAESFGPDERQVQLGQRGHGIGGHHTTAVTAGVQHEPGQPVDGLMAGDDGATVIGHEPDPRGRPARSRIRTSPSSRPAPGTGPRCRPRACRERSSHPLRPASRGSEPRCSADSCSADRPASRDSRPQIPQTDPPHAALHPQPP